MAETCSSVVCIRDWATKILLWVTTTEIVVLSRMMLPW